jgi:hypothetical protein
MACCLGLGAAVLAVRRSFELGVMRQAGTLAHRTCGAERTA